MLLWDGSSGGRVMKEEAAADIFGARYYAFLFDSFNSNNNNIRGQGSSLSLTYSLIHNKLQLELVLEFEVLWFSFLV